MRPHLAKVVCNGLVDQAYEKWEREEMELWEKDASRKERRWECLSRTKWWAEKFNLRVSRVSGP